jgi:hypothetical protein
MQLKRMGTHVRGQPLGRSPWGNLHNILGRARTRTGMGERSSVASRRVVYHVGLTQCLRMYNVIETLSITNCVQHPNHACIMNGGWFSD